MKTITLLLAYITITTINGQNINVLNDSLCGGKMSQHLDMQGHFNIHYWSDKFYQYRISESADSLSIVKPKIVDSGALMIEFQSSFPDVFNGDYFLVKTSGNNSKKIAVCNSDTSNPYDCYGFEFLSKIDKFYVLKYSGFETQGYLTFNTEDSLFYYTQGMPMFSKDFDKLFAFGYYSHMRSGLVIDFIEFKNFRKLSFEVASYSTLEDWNVLYYENTGNYGLAFSLSKSPIYAENEESDFEIVEGKECVLRVIID